MLKLRTKFSLGVHASRLCPYEEFISLFVRLLMVCKECVLCKSTFSLSYFYIIFLVIRYFFMSLNFDLYMNVGWTCQI